MKKEDLGYNSYFDSDLSGDFLIARVIAEYKELYKVKDENGEYLAKITGKSNFEAKSKEDYPAVGDWVAITKTDDGKAVIYKILSRKTVLKKKYSGEEKNQVIATNIDNVFAVESVDRDYNLNRLERFSVLAKDGGIKMTIILNKVDLISEEEVNSKKEEIEERFKETDVILTSTVTDQGLDELKDYLEKGKTYCFLGSSGVGKSSLINKLIGEDIITTEEIGKHAVRGKHTTTHREMYFLEGGGIVIDNPGMREVGLVDLRSGMEDVFKEIEVLSKECKYNDCTHIHEPGCAVLEAVKSKEIDEDKYLNYLRLKKETGHYAMSELERRRKDQQFGKFVKKVLKDKNEKRKI